MAFPTLFPDGQPYPTNQSIQRDIPLVVQQIGANFLANCGICGKSTRFGTEVEVHQLSNFNYGPTRDLFQIFIKQGGIFTRWLTSMETRLVLFFYLFSYLGVVC